MNSRIVTSTKPTPLITANRACHMITTSNFLYQALTFFTFLNIRCILPILNLLLKCTITTLFRVGFSIAFVADFSCAFRTFTSFLFRIRANNNRTFGIGTPFKIRIFLNLQIPNEKIILSKCGRISKILYEIRW